MNLYSFRFTFILEVVFGKTYQKIDLVRSEGLENWKVFCKQYIFKN